MKLRWVICLGLAAIINVCQAGTITYTAEFSNGILTIVPGALVIWFVRNHLAKGFALGRV